MPYEKFTARGNGRTLYAIRNIRTGAITRYKSKSAREKGIRMKEAFAHGWKPTRIGLANASYATRRRVASKGGRSRRRW